MDSRTVASASYSLESRVEQSQTSPLASEMTITTPPLQQIKTINRNSAQVKMASGGAEQEKRPGSVDPDALSRALMEFKDTGKQRERTPAGSPNRKRQRVYGDR